MPPAVITSIGFSKYSSVLKMFLFMQLVVAPVSSKKYNTWSFTSIFIKSEYDWNVFKSVFSLQNPFENFLHFHIYLEPYSNIVPNFLQNLHLVAEYFIPGRKPSSSLLTTPCFWKWLVWYEVLSEERFN